MKLSAFCGVSVDGILARRDHSLDFLDAGGQEPHGFEEFYGRGDVVGIGRETFEVGLTFGKWSYGTKPGVVLSSSVLNFSSELLARIEQIVDPATRRDPMKPLPGFQKVCRTLWRNSLAKATDSASLR